jgi:hypothetical protein
MQEADNSSSIRADLMYVYICMTGESKTGKRGCTFVDGDQHRVYFVAEDDLKPDEFRKTFSETVEDDDSVFTVHKEKGALHVTSMKRDKIANVDWRPYELFSQRGA